MLFDYINFKFFLISLAVGLFFVYVIDVPKKVIYLSPNIDNVEKVVYKDSSDNCYKYKALEIKCPSNPSEIEKVKIQ
tara:strand:- start:105 stop:335 length:231 start_codon:yes stop_codon:yes gene_type:complete